MKYDIVGMRDNKVVLRWHEKTRREALNTKKIMQRAYPEIEVHMTKPTPTIGTSIRLESEIKRWLMREARKENRSVSNLVNLLLRLHITKAA